MLAVYVDDFKMAGPTKNMKLGWDLIIGKSKVAKGIEMDKTGWISELSGGTHFDGFIWRGAFGGANSKEPPV